MAGLGEEGRAQAKASVERNLWDQAVLPQRSVWRRQEDPGLFSHGQGQTPYSLVGIRAVVRGYYLRNDLFFLGSLSGLFLWLW